MVLIEPKIITDSRGYFAEMLRVDLLEKHLGFKTEFVQINQSGSKKGVLRGLHYQVPPYEQAKLVRVLEGKVLDVAVDLRRSSATYKQHISVILSADKMEFLFIPRGFAHGYLVISDFAVFEYQVDNIYSPVSERGIKYCDNTLGIDWATPQDSISISEKDLRNPLMSEIKDFFD